MSSIANDAPTPKRIGSDGPLSAGLRVLHVLDHSAPLQSGYVSRTLAILREQRKLGWETAQLTTPRQGSALEGEEVQAGFTFQRTAGPGLVANAVPFLREWSEMTATTARILQVAESFTPQLIHAHSPVLNALPALRAARRLGLPVVYEVRAFWEDASVHNGSTTEGSPRYRASRAIESFVLRRVDAVTTICEGLRHDILARGISPNRVTVIPNGVDIETFEPTPKDTQSPRQKFRLQGRIVLGFVGSFYGYEGIDLLLHAVTMMGTAAEDIAILLVGGGPCDETWRALATTLGLGRQVVFAGRVPYEDVAAHYDLIDLFIYPRRSMRLTELVTPLKPLEAMAKGRIVLASDVGGHRELVEHGRTGFLFKADDPRALANAICELLSKPDRWPEVGRAARAYVERERAWPMCAARYRDVYAAALAQCSKLPPKGAHEAMGRLDSPT